MNEFRISLKKEEIFSNIDYHFACFIISNIDQKKYEEADIDLLFLSSMIVSAELSLNHICFIFDKKNERFKFYQEKIPLLNENIDFLAILKNFDEVLTISNEYKPLVLVDKRIYLHKYWYYESFIANFIKKHFEKKLKKYEFSEIREVFTRLNKVDQDFNSDNEDLQTAAVFFSLINNFTIISGGPGTGKTTIIAKALAIILSLEKKSFKFAIAAPTGKAAMRMEESLKEGFNRYKEFMEEEDLTSKIKPLTLHRLLGYNHNTRDYRFNSENKLDYDLIIVDEFSMVDIAMFYRFVSALKDETKIILLGDKNQLASVEAGSILADLCSVIPLNSFSEEIFKNINSLIVTENKKLRAERLAKEYKGTLIGLEKSYRFKDSGGIGKISKMIISDSKNSPEDLEKIIFEMKNEQEAGFKDRGKKKLEELLKAENIREKYREFLNSKTAKEALENSKSNNSLKAGPLQNNLLLPPSY